MLTVQTLLDHGYRKINTPLVSVDITLPGLVETYQKRVEDDHGVRYYLNVRHTQITSGMSLEILEPHVQFERQGTVVNVQMLQREESLDQVEAYFEEMWTGMGMDYEDGTPAIKSDATFKP